MFRWKGDHDDLNDYSSITFLSYVAFHYANAGDITSTGMGKNNGTGRGGI